MTSSPGRPVAIVAAASALHPVYHGPEATLVMTCVNEVRQAAGVDRVDFTMAGSCDYLAGSPFVFVMNIEGMGAWPPIYESHVEMDGAWALFEAWLRLQVGDVDTALVVGSGRPSVGNQREVFSLQTDPYTMAPLGLDPVSLAGLQARALLEAGIATEADFAAAAGRALPGMDPGDLLAAPYFNDPLRSHDVATPTDGAAAVLLVAGDRVAEFTDTPVWITGMDHRVESHHLGLRDLTRSPSAAAAAAHAGAADGPIDVAELMVVHSPEEIVLRNALGLGADTRINPSGGPFAANPIMATGLMRVVEVARRIASGEARRGLAHASSGPCLQQNLVAVLEGEL
ncbi:lipid-transfer protein [Actinocorallia libanotica]|uniref:Thiolase domain-containing protein n=1 Tax=Actinocorallia libanotica TaxID=46162 RepID=A0ABP4CFP7_9ACTN